MGKLVSPRGKYKGKKTDEGIIDGWEKVGIRQPYVI
jgi:hypothetical protein